MLLLAIGLVLDIKALDRQFCASSTAKGAKPGQDSYLHVN